MCRGCREAVEDRSLVGGDLCCVTVLALQVCLDGGEGGRVTIMKDSESILEGVCLAFVLGWGW